MAKEKAKADSKEKRKRVPFGAIRTKLQVDEKMPGYVLRWFNDVDGRIEQAIRGGYVYVSPDEVSSLGQGAIHEQNSDVNAKVSKIVSKGKRDSVRAFLMKIKQEWYDEDQAAKEEKNAEIDRALMKGEPGGNVVENQYVPKGHKQIV